MRNFGYSYLGIVIVSFFFTTGCTISNGTKEAVNNYLRELQQDPQSNGGQYRCLAKAIKPNRQPESIKNWEITKQEPTVDDRDADAHFETVQVKITERDRAGFDVTNTWNASVWKSDDLFEHQKRFFSDLDKKFDALSKTSNEIERFLGKPISTPETKSSNDAPNRDDITNQPYCVTNIRRLQP